MKSNAKMIQMLIEELAENGLNDLNELFGYTDANHVLRGYSFVGSFCLVAKEPIFF